MGDDAADDFAAPGPEDDELEVDVDVDDACAVADEALRGGDEGVKANAEAGLVEDFVGVFGVDPVFERAGAGFVEVGGVDLDGVGEGNLMQWKRVLVCVIRK